MGQSPSISLEVTVAMATDIGQRRKQNQDAIGHLTPTDPDTLERLGQIFVLADGVGGLKGGDLASQYAVSTIIGSYYEQEEGDPAERLARAIAEANNVIYAEGHGQDEPEVMATTVVVAVIRGRELVIGSVGDSPAYLMRDAEARQLTLDHNLEMAQREAGTPLGEGDPTGRKLVRALGNQPSVKVDIITGPVRGGDHVVLCSDGLTRYVSPEEIEQTVAVTDPDSAVDTLIALANERGGADNISVIVLRLTDEEHTEHGAPPLLAEQSDWERRVNAELSRLDEPVETPSRPHPPSRARQRRAQAAARRTAPVSSEQIDRLWQLARENPIVSGAGLFVLLIVFIAIMLLVLTSGGDRQTDEPRATQAPQVADTNLTATARVFTAATVQAQALQTSEANQVATETQAAILALTPPTPMPTSGPQMAEGMWFRMLDGDPIPAYDEPRLDADEASALEPGANYRISGAEPETDNGPWYWVIDNTGVEDRWVNGPSLHARIVAIDEAGNPLPDDQQPLDVPPPGAGPLPVPTATPTLPGTQGTPITQPAPGETPETPSPTATIGYGVETWGVGTTVALKGPLTLRESQSVDAPPAGDAAEGEVGTVVEGPVPAGGHWWWRVEFEDGRAGWIAQVLLGAP